VTWWQCFLTQYTCLAVIAAGFGALLLLLVVVVVVCSWYGVAAMSMMRHAHVAQRHVMQALHAGTTALAAAQRRSWPNVTKDNDEVEYRPSLSH
jgi:hypothetical protein